MATQTPASTRVRLDVRGLVQGVGFRPYVYALARRHALNGRVCNNVTGVLIDVEGAPALIEQFINDLRASPPPLALIEAVERSAELAPAAYSDFRIVESATTGAKLVPVSADIATCADCLRELSDPTDRRYRYPFINCTNCGPRFTIVEAIPYDRAQTTMRDFAMCAACRAEYTDPADRRFHAEPTACAACGPRLTLTDAHGQAVPVAGPAPDVVARTRQLLCAGQIVAVKGLGGYHLACDALDAAAVARLRARKYRADKPFALLANSVALIRRYCVVSPAEAALLSSGPRPVVLLARRPASDIPRAVAPGVNTLGFMLPYTPLHHLLVADLDRPLVMTSGNVSDEPICFGDDDARARLAPIADYFLRHDRRIHMRADDSVARCHADRALLLRRARGYAPAPLRVGFKFTRQILACGAELKNTFCLTRAQHAYLSHHIGDLENLETLRSFEQGIEHYKRLFQLRPDVIAHDLHPEYLSTKYAHALDDSLTKIGVQHHHAHVASCMADNLLEGAVIGVAMDGLGFGTDGRMWGGEFFVADFCTAERVAHLDYIPMPGGARAVREPWRMAAIYMQRALGAEFLNLDLPFVRALDPRAWPPLRQMAAQGTNSPQTSSMGRLFDAVASLLNLRHAVNYEGQAAIELEAAADAGCTAGYEFELTVKGIVKADPVLRCVVADMLDGRPVGEVAAKFHNGVAALIVAVAQRISSERRLARVVLSGGVFQNMFLLERTCRALRQARFEVFTHSRVPTNDGGIALGQAAVAHARLATGRL